MWSGRARGRRLSASYTPPILSVSACAKSMKAQRSRTSAPTLRQSGSDSAGRRPGPGGGEPSTLNFGAVWGELLRPPRASKRRGMSSRSEASRGEPPGWQTGRCPQAGETALSTSRGAAEHHRPALVRVLALPQRAEPRLVGLRHRAHRHRAPSHQRGPVALPPLRHHLHARLTQCVDAAHRTQPGHRIAGVVGLEWLLPRPAVRRLAPARRCGRPARQARRQPPACARRRAGGPGAPLAHRGRQHRTGRAGAVGVFSF